MNLRLNAPFGARCFLAKIVWVVDGIFAVLMHLLVLGAFWPDWQRRQEEPAIRCLNAPFGARCFLALYGAPYNEKLVTS